MTNFKINYPHLISEPVKRGVLFSKSVLHRANERNWTIFDVYDRLVSEVKRYTPKLHTDTLTSQTQRYVETLQRCADIIRKGII